MTNLGIPGMNLNAITSGAGGFAMADVGNFSLASAFPSLRVPGRNTALTFRPTAATAR